MTNCTVSEEDIKKVFNNNTEFRFKNHANVRIKLNVRFNPSIQYIYTNDGFFFKIIPVFIENILANI